jgi:cytochrome c-type biogenesis protein CcmH
VNKIFGVVLLSLIFIGKSFSEETNAQLERRVRDVAHELRCLVCQNQTLADSNAELAVDLRNTIREQLVRGASEGDVLDFMVARYGDFVLYRPPLKASTIALWAGPFVLLGLGAFFMLRRVRRRRSEAQPLSDAERARAAELLKE